VYYGVYLGAYGGMDAGVERTGMYLQRLQNKRRNTPTHMTLTIDKKLFKAF